MTALRKPVESHFLKVRELPEVWSWGNYTIVHDHLRGPFVGQYVLTWHDIMLNDELYIAHYPTLDEAKGHAERLANR